MVAAQTAGAQGDGRRHDDVLPAGHHAGHRRAVRQPRAVEAGRVRRLPAAAPLTVGGGGRVGARGGRARRGLAEGAGGWRDRSLVS